MKNRIVKSIIIIFIIILLLSNYSTAVNLKNSKNYQNNKRIYSVSEEDIDPLVDLELTITINKIRAFDKLDRSSDPDFYVKIILDGKEYKSPIWENQKVINEKWQKTIDIPDNKDYFLIKLQLWDADIFDDELCDIAKNDNNNPDRYDLLLKRTRIVFDKRM